MRWVMVRWSAGVLAALSAVSGCQGEERAPYIASGCFEGDVRECQCGGMLPGERVCENDAWSECTCNRQGEGGTRGTSPSTGGAGNQGSSPETTIELSALVNYHYDGDGVHFVTEEGVTRFDWSGQRIAHYAAERPLTASGYANGLLVVADSGAIVGLDADYQVLHETQVVESCASGGMITGHRFVCMPGSGGGVLYTYDGETGDLLATSGSISRVGLPVRTVPGSDQLVGVSGGSPRDYHLFEVDANDVPFYVADSIYHGDIYVGYEYGFVGEPERTHLVAPEGEMLNFAGADCNVEDRQCFLKDGNLGTLPGDAAKYVGLSDEQNGEVFALVSPSGDVFDGPCANSCILQRVEVATRSVLATKVVSDYLFWVDTRPQAYYLIPSPNGSRVWVVQSGRSIYRTGYDDSLGVTVRIVRMPVQ